MSEYSFIYITCKDKNEARTIGKAIVESRLTACANILDNMNSFYWWEGKVQDDTEAVLIAKTRTALVESLIEKVKSLHSYTCPCIVALPIKQGNPDFLKWLGEETEG